jgi:RNA polymerase sigma-70 factor (ECF subfamily)
MRSPYPTDLSAESSLALLARARAGDPIALDRLLARYGPRLKRWTHRRLPAWARDLKDTDDLVQDTLIAAVRNLQAFSSDQPHAFQEYLRVAATNAVRDQIRRALRRPSAEALDPDLESADPSPLERVSTRERIARYERALSRLSSADREAVIARLELGFTHDELAAALGKPSADAARKAVRAALDRLLSLMQHEARGGAAGE